jgi:hypothetical protein
MDEDEINARKLTDEDLLELIRTPHEIKVLVYRVLAVELARRYAALEHEAQTMSNRRKAQ